MAAPRESWGHKARRGTLVAAAAIIVLTGIANIAGQVHSWIRPPDPSPAPSVEDSAYAAVAVPYALDYLSWDQTRLPARQAALRRAAARDTTVDGWSGTGRQWADSATVLDVTRGGPDHAIVTVRARVTAYLPSGDDQKPPASGTAPASTSPTTATTADPSGPSNPGSSGRAEQPDPSSPPQPTAEPDGGGASGPVHGDPGWTAQPSRWLNIALPLHHAGRQITVTAPPAVVGSPPTTIKPPALDRNANNDAALAAATRGPMRTLLTSYGQGDLTYARAAGSTFTGLDNTAALATVAGWRVRQAHSSGEPGPPEDVAIGDADVTWTLPGGASLSCTYRIELHRDAGRWYLADITVPIAAVTR